MIMFIKKIDRSTLYYNRYQYKLAIKDKNLFYLKNCLDPYDYVKQTSAKQNNKNMGKGPFCNWRFTSNYTNIPLVTELLSLRNENYRSKASMMRMEGNSVSFFTNDLSSFSKLIEVAGDLIRLEEIVLSPPDTKFFKRTPPANYRLYLKGGKVTDQTKQDLCDYVNRNADLYPSSSLERWIKNPFSYCQETYYIDFNDERNRMMLNLIVPEITGKFYKLEKK